MGHNHGTTTGCHIKTSTTPHNIDARGAWRRNQYAHHDVTKFDATNTTRGGHVARTTVVRHTATRTTARPNTQLHHATWQEAVTAKPSAKQEQHFFNVNSHPPHFKKKVSNSNVREKNGNDFLSFTERIASTEGNHIETQRTCARLPSFDAIAQSMV